MIVLTSCGPSSVVEVSLALSQIGPLFIVGLLDHKSLSDTEKAIWNHSKLRITGGAIRPISSWQVGVNVSDGKNVTLRFA